MAVRLAGGAGCRLHDAHRQSLLPDVRDNSRMCYLIAHSLFCKVDLTNAKVTTILQTNNKKASFFSLFTKNPRHQESLALGLSGCKAFLMLVGLSPLFDDNLSSILYIQAMRQMLRAIIRHLLARDRIDRR